MHQRLADDGGVVGRAARGVRVGADPVPDHPGGLRLQPAGVGQLPRALRAATAQERERPLRAVHARAQLELRPHRHQPVPVPPAAAQRPPRQPDPALPDAAQHGRFAEPAQRLRGADRADLLPAAVAQADGPPGDRALRRRHQPGQRATTAAQEDAGPVRSRGLTAAGRLSGGDSNNQRR